MPSVFDKTICNNCLEQIPDYQEYFCGQWIPSAFNECGDRKFGMSPTHIYCAHCAKNFKEKKNVNEIL